MKTPLHSSTAPARTTCAFSHLIARHACLWVALVLAFAAPISSAREFFSTGVIVIPDSGNATPFPSTISVSGITGVVSAVRLKFNGVTHTFPSDLVILLLAPGGQVAAVMTGAGGGTLMLNVNLVFDDAAATAIPRSTAISSGTYRPANYRAVETVPPGGMGTVGTNLTELASGGVNGDWKLFVTDAASDDSGSMQSWSVVIETAGEPPAPQISVEQPSGSRISNGTSISFGSVTAGTNKSLNFTIRNIGTADLTGLGITIDGPDTAMFTVTTNPVAPVVPGGGTTFTVGFAPTSPGTKTGELHIASNDAAQNPFDVSLIGTGIAPVPEIAVQQPLNSNLPDGGSRSFGSVLVGTNKSLTFTIRNLGMADLTGLGITIDGPDAAMFTVTTNPIAPIAPGDRSSFTVQFTPASAGAKTGAVHIANNDANENPFDISLIGTGVTPVPEIAVEQPLNTNLLDGGGMDFDEVILGRNNSLTFTIRNLGTADLTGLGVSVDGPDAAMFTVTTNPVAPVAPSGSTTFTVRFTPSSLGSKTGALHIANNDLDENPFDLALTGTCSLVGKLWARHYGPRNGYDDPKAVAVDGSGNVVVTGYIYSQGWDYYTAKYAAADGALLWEKGYSGSTNLGDFASALAVDGDGNVVVTGSSGNGINWDYYTAKYAAADGTLVWEKRYNDNGPADGTDQASAVAVDGSGNVVVTGSSQRAPDFENDYYTAKYAAADGALLWEKRSAAAPNISGANGAYDLALDTNGNVVVTGLSAADCYTAKYAAVDGTLLWDKRYHGPGDFSYGNAVAVDGSGNVVVTGLSEILFPTYKWEYYTAKYAAANGALLWEKRSNGPGANLDRVKGLAVDGAGNVIVARYFAGEYITTKYAALDGALLWEKHYDAQPEASAISTTVAVDPSGNVVMAATIYVAQAGASYYTVKYAAADGAVLWEKRFRGGTVSSLALGPKGVVAVTGISLEAMATVVYQENLPQVSVALLSGEVRLHFTGTAGTSYRVERALAVTGPWRIIATPTAPPGGLIEYIDTTAPAGAAFYRLSTL